MEQELSIAQDIHFSFLDNFTPLVQIFVALPRNINHQTLINYLPNVRYLITFILIGSSLHGTD